MTNDGSATPFGCTVGGTAGAATSIFGSAKALRSPDTEVVSRDSTAPPTPVSAPAPRNPSVTSDSRLPRSGASAAGSASGSSVNRPDVSSRSTATPHAVPTTVGTMSTTVAPAREQDRRAPRDPGEHDRGAAHGNAARLVLCRHRRDRRDHRHHEYRQDQLVGRGEGLDRPLLDRTGREVDDRRPDRVASVGFGADERRASNWVTPSATAAAATPAIALAPRAVMRPSYPCADPKGLSKSDIG